MTATRAGRLLALFGLVAWPWLGLPTSLLGNANTAGIYLLVAASLVMLTGWVGQVSLAQASFVGVGSYVTAMATRGLELGFPFNLLVGAGAAATAATLLGLVALRVRGLYLAVATLIFVWVTDSYVFSARWMGGTGGSTAADISRVGKEGTFPFVDFSDRRTFYYVMLAACAGVIFALLNLRDSKVGRAFFAVRGSEIAAASFGIDVVRTKLVTFALSGFIAGMAGSLFIIHQGAAVADQFNLGASLFYLSVAVVGGLSSLGGAVAAALLFAALNEVFFRVEALAGYLDVVSALLLAGVLILYPGGLAAFGGVLRRRIGPLVQPIVVRVQQQGAALLARVRKAEPKEEGSESGPTPSLPAPTETTNGLVAAGPRRRRRAGAPVARTDARPVLKADGIVVRFGGLTAVNDVSLEVREGEIVGLIGPNGAGKTTLFNAVSGLNFPVAGTVEINGRVASGAPVHARAAMGLARTFQVLQLFPQLDVFQNLLVGAHLHSSTAMLPRLVLTKGAIEAELDSRRRVDEVLDLLDLKSIADRPIAGLPFGLLRMVELGRALVTGAPLIMLDEPASGLDNAETDRLSNVLRHIRESRGVSLLVIEHDVRMVTALTDYLYVIDRGTLIAEGLPADIQRNEAVISAYLGTAAGAGDVVAADAEGVLA